MDKITFAVEEDDFMGDYKTLHRVGCGDLRDPETVTITSPTRAKVLAVLEGHAFDDYSWDDIVAVAKPCIRRTFKSVPE